jgi:hypothetical protein
MKTSASLTGSHLRTYNTIFQHPISHNLEWRAVRSLLGWLGEMAEEPNGNFRVERNGQILTLHPSRTKDVAEPDDVMALRHFLERTEADPPGIPAKVAGLQPVDEHTLSGDQLPGKSPESHSGAAKPELG